MANRKLWIAALIIALVLAGCKENPKTLAKQTYDLTRQALSNPLKAVGGLVKAANIGRKVNKLSAADRKIYNEELARLFGQGAGESGDILSGLLGGDSALSAETLNALMEAIGLISSSDGALILPTEESATEPSGKKEESGKKEDSGKAAQSASSSGTGDWTWTIIDADGLFGKSTTYNFIRKIVFGNNIFIATSNNGSMAVSKDGIKWTPVDVRSIFDMQVYDHRYTEIAFGNGKFVAGSYKGQIAYSSDGVKWTLVNDSTFGDEDVAGILFGKDKFIAVAENNRKKAYSSDGIKWTAVDSKYDSIAILAYGNGRLIGLNNYETDGRMAYSTDFVKWTVEEDAKDVISGSNITAIAFGKDKFVAGSGGGRIIYSSDGIKWLLVNRSGIKFDIRDIIYDGSKFVAAGRGDRVGISEDGIKWRAVSEYILGKASNGLGYEVTAVAYGNGMYVAVGEYGKMAYSTGR
jgi:hypothetical protein